MEQALNTWLWGIFWHSSLRILISCVPAVSGHRTPGQVSHFPPSWAVSLCQLTNSPPSLELPREDAELRIQAMMSNFASRGSRTRATSPAPPLSLEMEPPFVWTPNQVHAVIDRSCLSLYRGRTPCSRLRDCWQHSDAREGKTETTQTLNHSKTKQLWWGGTSTLLLQRAS